MATGGPTTHINLSGDPATVITDLMIAVEHVLVHVPAKTALQLLKFCGRRIDASEARILADRYENGASDRTVEDLIRSDGKTSKAEAKKRASRAKATNANPDIANRMSNGTMSTEQADIIATAAAETNGAAACNTKLIEEVSSTSPEQGRKKAKKFVNDRLNANDVQNRHDKQERQRGWYRHRLPNGNAAITFHGSDERIDAIERNVVAGANAEYQADGGRDVPRHEHPRTNDQRGFDAAHKRFTNSDAGSDTTAGQASDNGQTTPGTQEAADAGASTSAGAGAAKSAPARPARKTVRDVVHVNVTLDQLSGADRSAIIASDGKPLPRSVFNEIVCGADIIAHIFDGNGELLWQGRKKRLATPAQINGLIARDGGCVQCGTHHTKCVAHHLLPWEAIDQGESNIDNLAFVCDDCHHRIHQRKLTLYYDPDSQTWKTRAALPHEIAPDNQHDPTKRGPNKTGPDRYRPEPTKPLAHEHRNNFYRKLF